MEKGIAYPDDWQEILKQPVVADELRKVTIEQLKQELIERLNQVVKLFEGEFCLALSGGLDSSVLAVLLHQEIKKDFFCFTIAVNEKHPDIEHAKLLANEFDCEYNKLVNFQGGDIIIQATSAGLNNAEGIELIPKEKLNPSMLIFEMIYTPRETRLVKDALEVGAQVITGENMLLHQGYAAFEIWTAQKPPREIMRQAVLEKLN